MRRALSGSQGYGVVFVDGEDFHAAIRIPLPTEKSCEDCGAVHTNRYKCDDCLLDQALCDGLIVPDGWHERRAT